MAVLVEENEQLVILRQWVENEATFYGRTDDDFLLIFLRGCKQNVEKCKKKLNAYYENRSKVEQWWTNRNPTQTNIHSLLQHRVTTAMMDKNERLPTLVITVAANYGPNLNNFNDYGKLHSFILDVILRRLNSQTNGIMWLVDCRDFPMWMALHFLSPFVIKDVLNSFYLAVPFRIKQIVFLNTPAIIKVIYKMGQPLLSKKIRQRVHFYGCDWSQLSDHVPIELLPEEYGGVAGSIITHQDAFVNEVLSFADYFEDDNEYGFPKL